MNLVQLIAVIVSGLSLFGIILILCLPTMCDLMDLNHDKKKDGDFIRFLSLLIIICIFAFLTTLTPWS